uniref:HAD family hydrolase n=1 Tax=Leyella stercorea TaxID=363265 RepID=UPI0026727987
MKRLYAFDFDGTLTTADTLLAFIRYACGTWRFIVGFLLHSPLLVLMKLKLYPNYRAKQRIFAWYFRGMELKTFDALCRQFAERNACLIRPKAKALLERLFIEGESVCVVSASIDNWVRPFFTNMATNSRSNFCVLGTQVETDNNGLLTGRFLTNNCYGAEKVERLCKQYPDLTVHRNDYVIEAFGD